MEYVCIYESIQDFGGAKLTHVDNVDIRDLHNPSFLHANSTMITPLA